MECGFRTCYRQPNLWPKRRPRFPQMKGNSASALIPLPLRKNLPIELFWCKTGCQANFVFYFLCYFFVQLSNLMFLFMRKTAVQSEEMTGLSKRQNIHLEIQEKSF